MCFEKNYVFYRMGTSGSIHYSLKFHTTDAPIEQVPVTGDGHLLPFSKCPASNSLLGPETQNTERKGFSSTRFAAIVLSEQPTRKEASCFIGR